MAENRKKVGDEKRERTRLYESRRLGIPNNLRLDPEVDQLLIDLQYTLGKPRVRIVEDAIREKAARTPNLRRAPEDFCTTKPRRIKDKE